VDAHTKPRRAILQVVTPRDVSLALDMGCAARFHVGGVEYLTDDACSKRRHDQESIMEEIWLNAHHRLAIVRRQCIGSGADPGVSWC
jgi:hypothetical protein